MKLFLQYIAPLSIFFADRKEYIVKILLAFSRFLGIVLIKYYW